MRIGFAVSCTLAAAILTPQSTAVSLIGQTTSVQIDSEETALAQTGSGCEFGLDYNRMCQRMSRNPPAWPDNLAQTQKAPAAPPANVTIIDASRSLYGGGGSGLAQSLKEALGGAAAQQAQPPSPQGLIGQAKQGMGMGQTGSEPITIMNNQNPMATQKGGKGMPGLPGLAQTGARPILPSSPMGRLRGFNAGLTGLAQTRAAGKMMPRLMNTNPIAMQHQAAMRQKAQTMMPQSNISSMMPQSNSSALVQTSSQSLNSAAAKRGLLVPIINPKLQAMYRMGQGKVFAQTQASSWSDQEETASQALF